MPFQVMVLAMKNTTILTVDMTKEIVVKLVSLVLFLIQLEMVNAMMNSTPKHVVMMEEIVAEM